MKITSVCQLDGNTYTMDFPNMTIKQFLEGKRKWHSGVLIQEAFSFLNADEREFLITGTPPYVWDKMFGETGMEE